MRLFVALQIPEAVRDSLIEFVAELRKTCPDARWVRLQGAHVTLKFIGEVSPEQAKLIREALSIVTEKAPVLMPTSLRDKVPDLAPFNLLFAGLGFFPDARRPRVFWAGIDGGPALGRLAAAIGNALFRLKIPRETREFQPHITLARLDPSAEIAALRAAVAQRGTTEFGRTKVIEFSLMQSVLKSAGAEYTRLASYPLSGEQAS